MMYPTWRHEVASRAAHRLYCRSPYQSMVLPVTALIRPSCWEKISCQTNPISASDSTTGM